MYIFPIFYTFRSFRNGHYFACIFSAKIQLTQCTSEKIVYFFRILKTIIKTIQLAVFQSSPSTEKTMAESISVIKTITDIKISDQAGQTGSKRCRDRRERSR